MLEKVGESILADTPYLSEKKSAPFLGARTRRARKWELGSVGRCVKIEGRRLCETRVDGIPALSRPGNGSFRCWSLRNCLLAFLLSVFVSMYVCLIFFYSSYSSFIRKIWSGHKLIIWNSIATVIIRSTHPSSFFISI